MTKMNKESRKNYLTKKEACEALYSVKNKLYLDQQDCINLEMIRICLVGEVKGYNLWGKSIEDTRPIFVESTPDTRKFYEQALEKAVEIAKEEEV